MKIAVVLHGNLRTFLMETRENRNIRVCDVFLQNIVGPNNPDIFISTDINDFYYNGSQYFCTNQIDIVNRDPFRLFHKVGFMPTEEARQTVERECYKLFGNAIKRRIINTDQEDITLDAKYTLLSNAGSAGSCPGMIVGQYKKLLACDDMIENYEREHNFKYDVIVKCRFDAMYNIGEKLVLSNYDYNNTDIYVPGIRPPIIYDFFAFGNKKAMKPYLRLYENLGFTLENGQVYMTECRNDGNIVYFGPNKDIKPNCQHCNRNDKLATSNVTIASEHHLFAMFNKLGIRYKNAGYSTYIYRYRDTSCQTSVDTIIKDELKLKDIVLVNHTPDNKENKQNF